MLRPDYSELLFIYKTIIISITYFVYEISALMPKNRSVDWIISRYSFETAGMDNVSLFIKEIKQRAGNFGNVQNLFNFNKEEENKTKQKEAFKGLVCLKCICYFKK